MHLFLVLPKEPNRQYTCLTTDAFFSQFIDVINNTSISEFEDQIEDVFDLDEYLRILAIDILTNNWDSYIEHGRNWYLYHEPITDKIHWLPWDYTQNLDTPAM